MVVIENKVLSRLSTLVKITRAISNQEVYTAFEYSSQLKINYTYDYDKINVK